MQEDFIRLSDQAAKSQMKFSIRICKVRRWFFPLRDMDLTSQPKEVDLKRGAGTSP